jgi:DNA polymerase-3 subunit gamma/tau
MPAPVSVAPAPVAPVDDVATPQPSAAAVVAPVQVVHSPEPEPEPVAVEPAPELRVEATAASLVEPEATFSDLPWEELQAIPASTLEPAAEVLEPAPVLQAEPERTVAAPAASTAEADDDEPPLGDYDYVEMDAESFEYDFDAVERDAPIEPEVLPAAQPATGLAADWLELFPKLGLSGMTGSIGANCTLISVDGDRWLLHLDPAHSALFNPTQQRRLNDALNQFHGRELKVQIELRKPEQETPAQAAARKRANRQREAEASIHQDPVIQQMIQQFAAVIRADSIEPLDISVNP